MKELNELEDLKRRHLESVHVTLQTHLLIIASWHALGQSSVLVPYELVAFPLAMRLALPVIVHMVQRIRGTLLSAYLKFTC
jgi:hypothetical protein